MKQNRPILRRTIPVTTFLFASLMACAQTINVGRIDSLLDALAIRDLAFGSLAISVDGQLKYQRALGYATLDKGATLPTTVNTKYRIGSVTKVFTAVMIFQLIDERKLRPDQKLSDFFPTITNASLISIRDLLNHQSGLADYTTDPDYNSWMDKARSHDEMLHLIAKMGHVFKAGERHEYSSTNYLLLGYIISKIDGMSFRESLNKRILSKLSLKNTYYGDTIVSGRNEASSYKFINARWEAQKETHMSIHEGAGSVVSTPADMLIFIHALFTGKLVTKSSLRMMTTLNGDYGHGLFANQYGSVPSFGHNGRIEEFYSALWYYPREKIAIAYCTNGINFPRREILEGVLKICFREAYEIPFSSSGSVTDKDFDQYTGRYTSDILPAAVVSSDGSQLTIETNGATMPLSRISKNCFYYPAMGYYFEFTPGLDKMEVKETDNTYLFKR